MPNLSTQGQHQRNVMSIVCGSYIVKTKYFLLFCVGVSFVYGTAHAQESSCPVEYTDEQAAFVGHVAYIGLARIECPNIDNSLDPVAGNLARIWGSFPSSEFECPIWKSTYEKYEHQAAFTLVKGGLKDFCEQTMRNYGPNGRVIPEALHFTVKPVE